MDMYDSYIQRGTYVHWDGAKYTGGWKDDKQDGEGEEMWPDQSVYKGEYKMGKKHGKGEFIWNDGNNYIG